MATMVDADRPTGRGVFPIAGVTASLIAKKDFESAPNSPKPAQNSPEPAQNSLQPAQNSLQTCAKFTPGLRKIHPRPAQNLNASIRHLTGVAQYFCRSCARFQSSSAGFFFFFSCACPPQCTRSADSGIRFRNSVPLSRPVFLSNRLSSLLISVRISLMAKRKFRE